MTTVVEALRLYSPPAANPVSVSERVLLSLAPSVGFVAQLGMRPQRSVRSFRAPP